jgi:hypothetical protein
MKSARSGSAAFGAVVGAAIVSSGIVGSLLGGSVAAEASTMSAAAPSVCGQPPASTSAARTVPAGQAGLVLDAISFSSSKTPKAKATKSSPSASTSASATAKATASAKASSSASPSSTAKATSTPKATTSATATPKASSSASSSPSSSPTKSASASPSSSPTKSASASPSPSPTGSGSKSPSPSPSPTKTKSAVQLCLEVQAITTKSGVHPGGTASYAIWVWPAGGAASGITVTISSKAASKAVTPKFTVCPTASGRNCKAGGIAKGTSDELQATAAVPSGTAAGTDISLTATAKASDATAPPAADAAIKITAKPSSKHSSSPSPTPTPSSGSTGSSGTTGTGVGATLPPGILPTVPLGVTSGAVVPQLPGPTTSAGSPGGLFPTVSPQQSASPSPYSAVLPNARDVRVTDAAATFPFGTRLIGGELVGLAVLAAALAIAIVRFSLRRPRAQHSKDAAS